MKNNMKKAPVKFREDLLYFQHFMLIFLSLPQISDYHYLKSRLYLLQATCLWAITFGKVHETHFYEGRSFNVVTEVLQGALLISFTFRLLQPFEVFSLDENTFFNSRNSFFKRGEVGLLGTP